MLGARTTLMITIKLRLTVSGSISDRSHYQKVWEQHPILQDLGKLQHCGFIPNNWYQQPPLDLEVAVRYLGS